MGPNGEQVGIVKFHAWFNPYRVANNDDPTKLISTHPARQ
ncbi:hypothetical protein, partial [Nonomuraea sp. NPDC001023]